MKPECPYRLELLHIMKMSEHTMKKMRADLTGDEVPKLVEIAKERSYELYQQKYDTQLEVLGMLTKLRDRMIQIEDVCSEGNSNLGMFKALPAYIE